MLGIFYNKNHLKDTLLVVFDKNTTKIDDSNKNYCLGFDDKNEISFINIFNILNHIELPSGFLLLTPKINEFIKQITNTDSPSEVNDNKFVVGEVIKCDEIKNSHLHLCLVDIGNQELQIVCGAKNVKLGLKVVVAQTGAILPNGKFIINGELLGNKSFGMLCSKKELNILNMPFNDNGIIELDKKFKIGEQINFIFSNTLK